MTPESLAPYPSDRYKAELLFKGPLAEEYAMLQKICPAAAEMSQRVGRFVNALPTPEHGSLRLLEIGGGTGITTLHLLARPDVLITSVDNAPAMQHQARDHLADYLTWQRLQLVENDALSFLRQQADRHFDVVASAYTLHNFLGPYRDLVLAEIFRVLQPGGLFLNGDRYGLEDTLQHLHLIQEEARHYFRTFQAMNRIDLLEHWIIHLFSDESPDHSMRLDQALDTLETIGFDPVRIHHRDGVNTLVSALKPDNG
ncbi:class I SAM-dependent methyltransferase [Candidatus Woesearchaeota archaeon]|nr:class I SAM-dependent methyltransferase [Candidatus Woesearchaeota archaeon]